MVSSRFRPHTSLVCLFGAVFMTFCCPGLAETQGTATESSGSLLIPGGLALLADAAGLDTFPSDPASAAERIFTSLLEADPPPTSASRANPVRQDLLSYLSHYNQLLQYLQKENLASAGPEAGKPLELSFPLAGTDSDIEKTEKLLCFFGVEFRLRSRKGDGISLIEPEFWKDRHDSGLQSLFRALGFRIPDRNLREIHISLKSERVPLLLDAQTWGNILSVHNQPEILFRRFIENPDAAGLYLALAACPQKAREALANMVEPALLLKCTKTLQLFGSSLRLEQGRLIFPGSSPAWEDLLGAPASSPALSLRALLANDDSIPLFLYSSLWASPVSVQKYLTASSERLRSYFEALKPYRFGRIPDTVATTVGQDLSRILRLATVDSSGLVFNLDGRIAHPLLHGIVPGAVAESGSGPVSLTPAILAKMLPCTNVSPYGQTSRADILEFFRYLQDTRPEMLSGESIGALVKAPEKAPIFLDLIGSIVPTPAILTKYLNYCRKVMEAGPRGWNVNRTRTSQSIFFLLSALCREGAISQGKANSLLNDALQAFNAADEALFAAATAEFLSGKLLPEISGQAQSAQDPLLSSLSGSQPPDQILFEGKQLMLDQAAIRLRRMQQTIQSQSHTSLAALLDAYRLLSMIQSSTDNAETADRLQLLSEGLNQIRTVVWTPGESYSSRSQTPRIRVKELEGIIESAKNRTEKQTTPAICAHRIAAQLHTELSVTLLAYCYAYSGAPDIDVLAYDPNFVRKHRFYTNDIRGNPTWGATSFMQDEEIGGMMEGSLSGLAFQLVRLQMTQSHKGTGTMSGIDIGPSMVFGIRQVRPSLRTDRSQEYVALSTRLGRELVSAASADSALDHWLQAFLASLVSQQRLEDLESRIQKGDSAPAIRILSRSELFLLGQAYISSSEALPLRNSQDALSSIISRITEIVPKPESTEYGTFQDEVNQYGIMLRSRIGLSQLSFRMIDSYERLENTLGLQYLYDRICDLKIRIAELNYALGLPAALGEIEADPAILSILPQIVDWRQAIARINALTQQSAAGWVDELIKRGLLTVTALGEEVANHP